MANELMNLNDLKNMGVDFKVTKSDIIDMLVEQARVNLNEQLVEAEKAVQVASGAEVAHKLAFYEADLAAVSTDPPVMALKSAIENYYGKPLVVSARSGHYYLVSEALHGAAKKDKDYHRYGYGPPAAFISFVDPHYAHLDQQTVFSLNRTIPDYTKAEGYAEVKAALDNANKLYSACRKQLDEFQYNASRARLSVLRQFLSLTAEGQKMLSLLDSTRNGKQIVASLNKGE